MELSVGIEPLKERAQEEEQKLRSLCERLNDTEVTCAGKNPDDDAVRVKYTMLKAEVLELQNHKTEGIPLNRDLQMALLRQHMKKQVAGLKDFLKHLQFTREELMSKKEKLQECINTEKQVVSHPNENVLNQSSNATPATDVDEKIRELHEKIKKMKTLNELRVSQLRILMARLYPQVDEFTVAEVTKKDPLCFERNVEKQSLLKIIELLVNASLVKSDPWIGVDSSMWDPYLELLTRTRLILRHPSNNNLIKLEKFHE